MAVLKSLQNFSKNPSTSNEFQNVFRFGPFTLSEAERRLEVGSKAIKLKPKDFDLLLVLVRSGPSLVSKEQLMDRVWPDSFVSEANLSVHVAILRKLFREYGGDQEYILTIPKFGYRFAEEVKISINAEDDCLPELIASVDQAVSQVLAQTTPADPFHVHVNSSEAILSLASGLRIEARKTTGGTEITMTMDDGLEPAVPSEAERHACDIRWEDVVLSTIRQGRRRSIRIAVTA
jgi:DNA-binding winged helix-turn-helix (wHTH) protein